MISLSKLKTLPRKTRLRKIISLLKAFELDIAGGREIDMGYLFGLVNLVEGEPGLDGFFSSLNGERKELEIEGAKIRFINQIRYKLQDLVGIDTAEWDLIDLKTGKLDPTERKIYPIHVFLEDIRSPFNVGAIFRTSEAFGVKSILLSKDTPLPTHRRAERTSRGTVNIIDWKVINDLEELGEYENIFALETGGISIEKFDFPGSGMVLVGSEELGLSPEAIRLAKKSLGVVSIPMGGLKRSLNVSVAFGILMYFWYRRFKND